MKVFFTSLACFLILSGCKEDCTQNTEAPYNKYLNEFTIVDVGSGKGGCGVIIEEWDSSTNNIIEYKPINLPKGISFDLAASYKGTIEILPSTYTCQDSRPDPLPGKPSPSYTMHFVHVLDWERR